MAGEQTIQLFIDGQYREPHGGEWFEDKNPATGQMVAKVAKADAHDVNEAVDAAKRALRGPWAGYTNAQRADLLDAIADGIMARHDEFLAAEIADTGKPIALASKIDIPRGAANFRIFAQVARDSSSESYHTPTPDGAGALNYVMRQPVGVVGVICPWNLPLLLMTWKVAPALATGNTVVVKPSEETPATATLLGEVMNAVGVPPGVFNVVHGFGPNCAGAHLVAHPDVAAITFTGESRTGQHIMATAAEGIKAVSFELGGKNPAIVFADADFDAALAGTVRSSFTNTGQVCLCSERVYVQRPIYERFVEAMAKEAKAFQAGDPWSKQTNLGPLISAEHKEKVLGYYALARDEGATVVAGGGSPAVGPEFSNGNYVEPTVITGLADSARSVREEIFGPLCHIAPFDDEDEVIARANDTEYGLCAALWTQDLSRGHRVAAALDVGVAWVNTWFLRDLRTPFGGQKMSGIGREGGHYSLEFYTELKNICVKL